MLNLQALYGKENVLVNNKHALLVPFKQNHCYQFRLMSDEEILNKTPLVYTAELLKSKRSTLDSAMFGATEMNSECEICHQRQGACPGHYAVLKLPFPIVRIICQQDFETIIHLICPLCSHFYTPNVEMALELAPEKRLDWIKNKSNNYAKNGGFIKCACCHNDIVPIKVMGRAPYNRYVFELNKDGVNDQVNPCEMYHLLQNFTQIEECGFSANYHPRNFMTTLLPIVPIKLRPKTNQDSDSCLTGYYKDIIEREVPELDLLYKQMTGSVTSLNAVIKKGEFETKFNIVYDRMMCYYHLMTITNDQNKDVVLKGVDKRDRSHFDVGTTLLGKLKGKEKSIFSKGIVAARHNVTARTVLGGAYDAPIKCVCVPFHIASKLSMLYPVYDENLKICKQIVAAMSDPSIFNDIHFPHVIYIEKGNNRQRDVNFKNALEMASMLKPGDKIAISLMNGDLVMSSRFPSVREESWNSMMVMKDNNSIVTLPLATIGLKMGDFDGDEAQIYVASKHFLDIEALMLHSPFAQFIEHKTGDPGIWFPYTGDAAYGLAEIKPGRKSVVLNGEWHKEYNVIDVVNTLLPKDLNYKDSKLEIKNGLLVSDKTGFRNSEFFKYYAALYTTEMAEELMDKLSQLAYDLLIDKGAGLGFELRIMHEETKSKIRKIIKATEHKMLQLEMSNAKNKGPAQIANVQSQKKEIKTLLIEDAKGTAMDKAGYTTLRQEEWYHTVVMLDHMTDHLGGRFRPILAEGSRSLTAFPRFSIDPRAYGYAPCGYNGDLPPYSHFFDTKQQRFSMFQKGQGTAKQGYFSKKLGVTYGSTYVDYNGSVVNNFRNISICYNCCGLNPRAFVKQPLIDFTLSDADFNKKYADDKRLIELRKDIASWKERYSRFTCYTKTEALRDIWIAGFNYEQYINSNVKPGKTPRKDIEDFIKRIRDVYKPPALDWDYILENLKPHEYYFRAKLMNYECTPEVLDVLFEQFEWSLCGAGEPVGMKASLSVSEPLTQASLHAIHHATASGASVEHIIRSAGIDRFQELIGSNSMKNNVVTFVLYDDSKQASLDFANEQETFYFSDIWTRMELAISKTVDPRVLNQHPDLHLDELEVNPYYITSIWNLTHIAQYNIHVTEVIERLMSNFNEIFFITGWILNATEFMAVIYFKPTVQLVQIRVLMEEWGLEKDSTVIHGKYLKNCFVSENMNRPGHFMIEANEATPKTKALENLILDERVDPLGCKSNNLGTMLDMYGIHETCARLYEELIYTATNLSDTSGVLQRHYKCIADDAFVNGDKRYGARESVRKDRMMDTFKAVHFETASDMIRSALKNGDVMPVAERVGVRCVQPNAVL